MKIVLVSDTHIHNFLEFAVGDDRLLDTVSVFSSILRYCLKHKISCVVHGGDLFHKPGVLHTKPYNLVVKELAKFKKHNIRFLAIHGNHDQADKAGQVHAIESLHRAGLLEGFTTASFKTWHHEGLAIQGFPYCDSREEFLRRVEKANKVTTESKIGIFHHGFKGARVGTHLEYQVKEPLSAKKLLRGTDFIYVFSGHFHHHQIILGHENACYIGSPLEHSRASKDCISDKGFLVYDANENNFDLVPLNLSRFVSMSQVDLDANDFTSCKNNFVDVEWTEYKGGKERLEKHLKLAGARAWKLIEKKDKAYEAKQAIDPTAPPAEALREFLAERREDILERGLKPKKVLRLALEFLQQAGEEE